MTELFAKSLDKIHFLMENFDEEDFSTATAILFEKCLVTLCYFCIGGQRREFVVNFTLEVNF